MKKSKSLLLVTALFFLCLLSACTRTTMVHGRITNIWDGSPIVGTKVALYVYDGNEPHDSANPKKVGESTDVTDVNGEYALEYSGTGIDKVGLYLDDGYGCSSFFGSVWSDKPQPNRSREVNIQVDPVDGKIELVLQNQSGISNNVYLRVDCDATGEKGYYCCNYAFENTILPGQSDTVQFNVSAGRFVPVYWGEQQFAGWNSPHVDSVFCPRGQTTPLVIKF
jgi:hypothetical protein